MGRDCARGQEAIRAGDDEAMRPKAGTVGATERLSPRPRCSPCREELEAYGKQQYHQRERSYNSIGPKGIVMDYRLRLFSSAPNRQEKLLLSVIYLYVPNIWPLLPKLSHFHAIISSDTDLAAPVPAAFLRCDPSHHSDANMIVSTRTVLDRSAGSSLPLSRSGP